MLGACVGLGLLRSGWRVEKWLRTGGKGLSVVIGLDVEDTGLKRVRVMLNFIIVGGADVVDVTKVKIGNAGALTLSGDLVVAGFLLIGFLVVECVRDGARVVDDEE